MAPQKKAKKKIAKKKTINVLPAKKVKAKKVIAASPKSAASKKASPKKNRSPSPAVVTESVSRKRSSSGCTSLGCDSSVIADRYCRLHYIQNWKRIKRKELILKEGKLNQYIEELVSKYPDRYIEAIRGDLADDAEYSKVVDGLDYDEDASDDDSEGESIDQLITNIRQDSDDEGDTY